MEAMRRQMFRVLIGLDRRLINTNSIVGHEEGDSLIDE